MLFQFDKNALVVEVRVRKIATGLRGNSSVPFILSQSKAPVAVDLSHRKHGSAGSLRLGPSQSILPCHIKEFGRSDFHFLSSPRNI